MVKSFMFIYILNKMYRLYKSIYKDYGLKRHPVLKKETRTALVREIYTKSIYQSIYFLYSHILYDI